MKLKDEFIMECVEERITNALKYGLRRAYKHSDKEPPSEDQVSVVREEVLRGLHEMVEYDKEIEY